MPPDLPAFDVVPTDVGYDRWSSIYDDEDNPLVQLEEQHVGRQLGEVRGLRIADVGCGTGRHALRLHAAGARVKALDFSAGMLARARAKPGAERVDFVRADVARPLPLRDASFDGVVCCLVLEHIVELGPFFRELRRIGRPGAFVIVSAMHPAMMLRGISARFVDPANGRETRPASRAHSVSDFVMAAVGAGLRLAHLSEHAVDDALAARSPRAQKYLGWPMLLLMRLAA